MQALLQRVQELVISHANVPSNGAHWSAVLETASGKEASKEAKQARVDKAALEVASSMANLAQARAEVLQLAAADLDQLEDELRPVAGPVRLESLAPWRLIIEKSEVRNSDGTLVDVIG